ncbi:hypothetical protein E2I00_003342, partial [Balaenoptera physalus]
LTDRDVTEEGEQGRASDDQRSEGREERSNSWTGRHGAAQGGHAPTQGGVALSGIPAGQHVSRCHRVASACASVSSTIQREHRPCMAGAMCHLTDGGDARAKDGDAEGSGACGPRGHQPEGNCSFRNELETSLVYEAHVANRKISQAMDPPEMLIKDPYA